MSFNTTPGTTIQNSSGTALASPKIEYGTISGPASYSSGGFVLDLSARFASIKSIALTFTAESSIALPDVKVTLDSPNPGKVTVACYVVTTGIEVTAATNLSTLTWSYLAIGN